MNSSIRLRKFAVCLAAGLSLLAAIGVRAAEPIVVPAGMMPATAGGKPQMGINLEQVVDYAHSMMFVDTIKSGRRFGSPTAPWDEKAAVDEHGWPTQDAGIVVMADVTVPPGDYTFSCTGTCALGLINTKGSVRNLAYNRDTNTTTATVAIDPGSTNLFLSLRNTGTGAKNIRLLRPGYALNTDQVFTKEFLAAIAPFSAMRTMDFTRTNDTDVSDWKDRPLPDDALQTSKRGVAWEFAIQLANQTKKDLWINVPDRATDDYVKQLAQLFKDKLDPERAVYLEYSNEVWNNTFRQSGRNLEAAKAEVAAGDHKLNDGGKDDNQYYWGWKRVSKRLLEMTAIFKQVMGEESINTASKTSGRIRPVLASQSANPFMTRMQVEFIQKYYGPPSQYIYGIAGAPYLGPDDKIANGESATVDALIKATNAHGWVKDVTMQYLMLAREYGVHHLCYEGGLAVDGEKNLEAKIGWNKDPRIAQIGKDYFDMWYGQGGELFMYYNLCGPWGKYGAWGLTDDIHVQTTKMKAILDYINAPAPPISMGAAVPGTILAWQFTANVGGGVENSADGGKNLAYLQDGNTFEYLLNVKEPGDYVLTMQASGGDEARLELSLSGTSLGTVKPVNTGNGQKWDSSEPIALKLERGQLVLLVRVSRANVNVRSFTFTKR